MIFGLLLNIIKRVEFSSYAQEMNPINNGELVNSTSKLKIKSTHWAYRNLSNYENKNYPFMFCLFSRPLFLIL